MFSTYPLSYKKALELYCNAQIDKHRKVIEDLIRRLNEQIVFSFENAKESVSLEIPIKKENNPEFVSRYVSDLFEDEGYIVDSGSKYSSDVKTSVVFRIYLKPEDL
jgi:hypothetical protein